MSNGKLFLGLALGALAGSALACFAHSHKGKKVKMDLYETLHDLRNRSCTCNKSDTIPQPDEVIEVVAGKVEK